MFFLSCVLLFGVWPKALIVDVNGTARRCPRLLQTQAMATSQHLWLVLFHYFLLCLYFVVDLLVLLGVTGG